MKNFLFEGLCVVLLLCHTSDLAGQMTELAVANGHCEGKMYLQDGEIHTDPGVQIGTCFAPLVKYRMSAYDLANNESEKTNYVTTSAGGINKPVVEHTIEPLPTTFAVHPAYPNPFNSSVVIEYELPQESLVRIEVYDILGRLIWESNKEILPAGYYQFYWDSQSSPQSLVPSGVYSFVILINNKPFVQKAVYIK